MPTFKAEPLKKSEAEQQMEANFGKMRTIAQGFRPPDLSEQGRREIISYYDQHKGQARELLDLGAALRAEGAKMGQAALTEMHDAPRAVENVYTVGVAGVMTSLFPVGKIIMESGVGYAIRGVSQLVSGEDIQVGTWAEAASVVPDAIHMVEVTAKAYEALGKAYEKYQAALKDTYAAYQNVIELKNSGDEAGAAKAIDVLNGKIRKLDQARESLVSAINIANEAGDAFQGAQGVADKFVFDSGVAVVTSIVGGAVVERGVHVLGKGIGAGVEAAKGGATAGESAKAAATAAKNAALGTEEAAEAGATHAAERAATVGGVQAVRGAGAAERAAVAAGRVERVTVSGGEAGYKGYEVGHTAMKQHQVEDATEDRAERNELSSNPNYQI